MSACTILRCFYSAEVGSFYCSEHKEQLKELGLLSPQTINKAFEDHIKIGIEQSAKGARVTISLDRADHDIEKAITQSVNAYQGAIGELKSRGLKVDENGGA